MGMYCACGVKKTDPWKCECDWDDWFLCFESELRSIYRPIKLPEKDGKYLVRVFEEGDEDEEESKFSVIEKNWGQPTNQIISNWEIEYSDGWTGYRGVYAWKELPEVAYAPTPKPEC